MNEKTKIEYVTDGWTSVLLFDGQPTVILWNPRRPGISGIVKIIGKTKSEKYSTQLQDLETAFTFNENIETLKAVCVGKSYEVYFESTQRHYSKFVSVFNDRNNIYRKLPVIDKEFFYTFDRLFYYKTFGLTQEIEDFKLVDEYENVIRQGERPFVLLYQYYISQSGKYEDGDGWRSINVSPYFVIHGNHLLQAYRNLNIEPNFVLKTEKIKGNGVDEFMNNTSLINETISNYLNDEEIELINKYK